MKLFFVLLSLVAVTTNAFQNVRISPAVQLRPLKTSLASRGRSLRMVAMAPEEVAVHDDEHGGSVFEPPLLGLRQDLKRKSPHFISEWTDGFNVKAVASTFFLFFACLAPAVAFGGLLGTATGGAMGTMETVGATALGGMIYAMFSAQPLTIIGTTGPLLAFLNVLYATCQSKGIPFLPVYAWTGLWSAGMLLFASVFSTSNVVNFFTQFTDDIFSTLISVIFIYEACRDIFKNFTNPAISGLRASITLITAATTYITINTLKALRGTPYLPREIRTKLSDFAPTLGVLSGVGLSKWLTTKYGCAIPMLAVPDVFATTSGRPWIVDIFSLDPKLRLLCFLPALMATTLLFMDQNITVHLVMSKENKLKKGSGLHLDMLVVSAVTALMSILGMPWMVAATVRSIAHVNSLKNFDVVGKTDKDPGTLQCTGVQEQRVSGLAIHSLIGAAIIFNRDLLRQIPTAVLTGLFMYLGTSSIDQTDFYDRAKLFVTDDRDVPQNKPWSPKMMASKLGRTKLFTAIQLALLGGMWYVKVTKWGVFFPIFIGMLAPIRIAMEKFGIFKKEELAVLDSSL